MVDINVAFLPGNLSNNKIGRAAVHQIMNNFRALGNSNFKEKPANSLDGQCMISVGKCKGVEWDAILEASSDYFLKQQLPISNQISQNVQLPFLNRLLHGFQGQSACFVFWC